MTDSSIMTLLRQDGPFATGDEPPDPAAFSRETKKFAARLRSEGLITRYRVLRDQICSLLGTENIADIHRIEKNPEVRERLEKRTCLMLGNMFGFEGRDREIIARIKDCSATADSVIRFLKGTVMRTHATHIEITNEIDVTSNPAELLLINLDPRYHKKARFEAKRKLVLMLLAGAIEQRERETGIEKRFAEFLDFLNDNVWSPKIKIGDLDLVYLLSDHDPEDYSCRKVEVISPDEARAAGAAPNRKLTLIKRRRFKSAGNDIPIYVSIRRKGAEAKVLKLLRKGKENPAIAVDDELGLMGVVDSIREVKLFQKHLAACTARAKTFMGLEDLSDTLAGGEYHGNRGSSGSTSMLKFFARMEGMRVEFIIHTNRSYIDYIYRRGVAHEEYEIKRLFDTGVIPLLFPGEIYRLDHDRLRDDLLRECRARIEAPMHLP